MTNVFFDTTKGDVQVNPAWLQALMAQANTINGNFNNVTLTGLLFESFASGIVAGTTRT